MGKPILDPEQIPVNALSSNGFLSDLELSTPWGQVTLACASMGNPHAVWFLDDIESLNDELFTGPKTLENLNIDGIGRYLESHAIFPEKSNIEFVEGEGKALKMRVYERGCGETLACGTGACAVAVTAALTGRASRSTDVLLKAGTLHITWEDNGEVVMSGGASTVFAGEFYDF